VPALTTVPPQAGTLAVTDVPEPVVGPGDLLVDGIAVGVCGTDKEIAHGDYGWAPAGHERLVLGHESLGRVRHCSRPSAGSTSPFWTRSPGPAGVSGGDR
jgi:glucose 1-dehydrogenase